MTIPHGMGMMRGHDDMDMIRWQTTPYKHDDCSQINYLTKYFLSRRVIIVVGASLDM